MNEARQLYVRLDLVTRENARERFTELFRAWLLLFRIDDKHAARLLDTSVPNVVRWRTGEVVPPAAYTILCFISDSVYEAMLND